MITEAQDFLIRMINDTMKQDMATRDMMSDFHYHNIHIDEKFLIENLTRAYNAAVLKVYKNRDGNTNKFRTWYRTQKNSLAKDVKSAVQQVYTPSNILKTYKHPDGKSFSVQGNLIAGNMKLIVPPGQFTNRPNMAQKIEQGNFTYLHRMFAALFRQAVIKLKQMRGVKANSGLTVRHPGQMTHGLIGPGGKPMLGPNNNLHTAAKYGVARKQEGIGTTGLDDGTEMSMDAEASIDTDLNDAGAKVGGNAYNYVMNSYKNVLDTTYNFKQIRRTHTNYLDTRHEIEMEYSNARHNRLMGSQDFSGIKAYVRARNRALQKIAPALARRYGTTVMDMRGSKTLRQRVKAVTPHMIIQSMFPHVTKADMRYKVNKKLVAEYNSVKGNKSEKTSKRTKGTKVKSKRRSPSKKGIPFAVPTGGVTRVDEVAGSNPMALRNLLNEALPQAIAKNMVAPRLQFRTGRFANSVRVDNITTGPRGGNMLVESSYRNDPYETFAPGGKKYTRQRDPERLIKNTIREIASGIIGARFNIKVD